MGCSWYTANHACAAPLAILDLDLENPELRRFDMLHDEEIVKSVSINLK